MNLKTLLTNTLAFLLLSLMYDKICSFLAIELNIINMKVPIAPLNKANIIPLIVGFISMSIIVYYLRKSKVKKQL